MNGVKVFVVGAAVFVAAAAVATRSAQSPTEVAASMSKARPAAEGDRPPVVLPARGASQPIALEVSGSSVAKPPRRVLAIVGHVTSDASLPVAGVELTLSRAGRELRAATSGMDGSFAFSGLSPGSYAVRVDRDTVQLPHLPPVRCGTSNAVTGEPSDVTGSIIELVDEDQATEIVLPTACRVEGVLTGPAREPVSGFSIMVQRTDEEFRDIRAEAVSDDDGRWSVEGLYPGTYRAQLASSAAHAFANLGRPAPLSFDLRPGASAWVPLELGGGAWTVRGVVRDQDGNPFEDLEVLAFFWKEDFELLPGDGAFGWNDIAARGRTDAQGVYELQGLPRATVKIQFEPQFSPSAPAGTNRIVSWGGPESQPTVELGRSAPGIVEVAPVQLTRSRPFHVEGTVLLDAAWASRNDVTLKSLRLYACSQDGSRSRIRLNADGTFEWSCEATEAPVTFMVSEKGADDDHLRMLEITPLPAVTQTVTISIP